jgi:hypothetical protein
MEAIDVFGPKLSAMLVVLAVVYFLISFAPVWWPALKAFRAKPRLPRPLLFVATVAALVYGVFSFLAFAVLLPVEAYGIFIAPSLETAAVGYGAGLLRISGFFTDYWWVLVPPVQFLLTWYITAQVGRRWAHICAAPPNYSFKPKPLRGSA